MEKYIICECYSPHHLIRLEQSEWRKDNKLINVDILVQPLLNPNQSFWQRLWIGICYIFGHESKFGCFEEIILNTDKCRQIINFLEDSIETKNSIES